MFKLIFITVCKLCTVLPLVYCVSYLIIDPSRQRTQTDSHIHILASSRNQIFQPTFSSTVMILML